MKWNEKKFNAINDFDFSTQKVFVLNRMENCFEIFLFFSFFVWKRIEFWIFYVFQVKTRNENWFKLDKILNRKVLFIIFFHSPLFRSNFRLPHRIWLCKENFLSHLHRICFVQHIWNLRHLPKIEHFSPTNRHWVESKNNFKSFERILKV